MIVTSPCVIHDCDVTMCPTGSDCEVPICPPGSSDWRSTQEVVKASWITVRNLVPGTTYEVQLVAKDERGQLLSITKEAIAGTDPGIWKQTRLLFPIVV